LDPAVPAETVAVEEAIFALHALPGTQLGDATLRLSDLRFVCLYQMPRILDCLLHGPASPVYSENISGIDGDYV
jgi:hypothetical protein